MKRLAILIGAILLFWAGQALAEGTSYVQKTFVGNGTFQAYINFEFSVPSGNCGGLQVYEYKQGFPFFNQIAKWELKAPGASVGRGLFRFVNNAPSECPTNFSVSGYLTEEQFIGSWQALEVEPEDLNLLRESQWTVKNYYKLSTDDKKFSYQLVHVYSGMNSLLGGIDSQEFIFMNGTLVGMIIPDSKGFISKKILKKNRAEWRWYMKNYMLTDQQVVVLIYAE